MMRRLLRHVFTICSALSLLLCVAVCVLWVRSYSVGDVIDWKRQGGETPSTFWDERTTLYVGEGGALVYWRCESVAGPEHTVQRLAEMFRSATSYRAEPTPQTRRRSLPAEARWGFYLDRSSRSAVYMGAQCEVRQVRAASPFWPIVLLSGLPSLVWLSSRISSRRAKRVGRCICGYDLRAHHAGDRCPECGTAVNAAG